MAIGCPLYNRGPCQSLPAFTSFYHLQVQHKHKHKQNKLHAPHHCPMDTLAQLFPEASETKLRNALASANDDPNLATSILLSEMSHTHTDRDKNAQQLASMFPDVDHDTVAKVLADTSSLEDAIERLLMDNAGLEDATEKLPKSKVTTTTALGSAQGSIQGTALVSDIDTVQTYGHVSRRVAQDLCAQYNDPMRALIQLVYTHRELRLKYPNGIPNGIPKSVPHPTGDVYQASLLPDLVQNSARLSSISPRFLEKALEYFNGDPEPTASLLILLAERNYGKHTGYYTLEAGQGPSLGQKPGQKPGVGIVRGLSTSTTTSKNKALAPAPAITRPVTRSGDGSGDDLDSTTLDFHGWLPEDAQACASRRLARWWNSELAQRERNNHRLNQITAINVPPITLVTGRGLHSAGGIPRVRIRVQRMLDELNYVYIEEPSRFIVTGKRRAVGRGAPRGP